MRVAVYGCKHDAALFEQMLRDLCVFDRDAALDNTLIDSAGLGTTKVGPPGYLSCCGCVDVVSEPD